MTTEKITQEEIDTIIESLYNGQYKQAKSQIMDGCENQPEKLAYRVGFVIETLCLRSSDIYEEIKTSNIIDRFLTQFE